MNHPIAPFLKRFFGHYLPVQKGLSIHTLCAYRDALKLLLFDVADRLAKSVDQLDVEDLTESQVLHFLERLESIRGCSASTRNARLAAIRSLFAFIPRQEPVLLLQAQQVRAIPLKRTAHPSIPYLEEKQMQAVHADLNTTHIYLEIDMETKRKMLAKTEPPTIRRQPPWHKPHILKWLDQLTKRSELCAVSHPSNPRQRTNVAFNST